VEDQGRRQGGRPQILKLQDALKLGKEESRRTRKGIASVVPYSGTKCTVQKTARTTPVPAQFSNGNEVDSEISGNKDGLSEGVSARPKNAEETLQGSAGCHSPRSRQGEVRGRNSRPFAEVKKKQSRFPKIRELGVV